MVKFRKKNATELHSAFATSRVTRSLVQRPAAGCVSHGSFFLSIVGTVDYCRFSKPNVTEGFAMSPNVRFRTKNILELQLLDMPLSPIVC